MARLILFRDGQKLAVDLRDGVYVVGRDDRADIVIPDHTVSSRHAEVHIQGDRAIVHDLNSSNGTFINGNRMTGSRDVTAGDDIRFGAARVAIELERDFNAVPAGPTRRMAAQSVPDVGIVMPQVVESTAGPIAPPKQRLPWGVSLWLAGAGAIAFLVVLLLIIEMFSQRATKQTQIENRFAMLAAQYSFPLQQSPRPPLPAPMVDQWLTAPILILDRDAKVIYPPQPASDDAMPSPLIDPKTKQVNPQAKTDLITVRVPAASGPPIVAKSYPIRYNGELLGYVVAQPSEGFSNLGLIALIIACAALVALFVLYFALRPVVNDVRGDVQSMQEKVSAVAHGFIEELPRSARMRELNDLAAEVESVVKSSRNDRPVEERSRNNDSSYAPLCASLLDAAKMPYCFVGSDFQLLAANRDLGSIAELNTARIGVSIFETGMTSLQSKQIVRALTDARGQGEGRATTMLTRGGESRDCTVYVRRLLDPIHREPIFGIVFDVRSA